MSNDTTPAVLRLSAELGRQPRPGTRTWGDGKRCDECCNGDRCDDPTHYDRTSNPGCPHCLNTGWALWTEAGQRDYQAYDDRMRAYREQTRAP